MCLFECSCAQGAGHSDCCDAMHECACLNVLVHKAYTRGDCCEAMHECACLCVLMHKVHAHGDCCKAMHACV